MPRGRHDLKLDNTRWPEERTDRLRRMFAAGCRDEDIALAIGTTTRAVIGKRLRLGLKRYAPGDALQTALRRAERERAKEDGC